MLKTQSPRQSGVSGLLKAINAGSSALLIISGLALTIMVLLVSYDVLMRNLFGSAMTGVNEYVSEWLMPATVLFALAYTERKNEHIRVTIVEDYIQGAPQRTLKILGHLTTLIVAAVLTWSSYHLAVDSLSIRETVPMGTELLAVWPIKILVVVAWFWLLLQIAGNFIAYLISFRSPPTGINFPKHESERGSDD